MSDANKILPEEILRNIEIHSRIASAVYGLLERIRLILDDNKLTFFPDYTDHGAEHINLCLQSAIQLIPDKVRKLQVLTSDDWAVLACATLLHDCGMHLRPAGFQMLITGDTHHRSIPWFTTKCNDLDWPDAWYEYLREAKRWSDERSYQIFGKRLSPTEPGSDWRTWDHTDTLFIGEFIRRHHARLAHEVVHYGFPGLSHDLFPPLIQTFGPVADVIGLIARSHGLSMRLCVSYLKEIHGSERRPLGVLAAYHMALLRIADYLQIQSSRAPSILFHLRDVQSPVSIGEWKKHAAVSYLGDDDQDPRALYVHLNSTHALTTHLQVKSLVLGLQTELDLSSAVLREVYGQSRDRKLARLELRKTRVTSNLGSKQLHDALPYVAEVLQFRAAGFDLLRLLVEPLYGNRPDIGIRELLQNAIDAVKERFWLEKPERSQRTDGQEPYQPEVIVSLVRSESGSALLTVQDNGIGMTPDTLRDYFLTVGKSFRVSDEWRSYFTTSDGSVEITRTGRFGIGVLAAFLLGDEIEVTTRSRTATQGVYFRANLATSPILLNWVSCPIGTRICVHLRSMVTRRFDRNAFAAASDWYACRDVKVTRIFQQEQLEQKHNVPAFGEDFRPLWRAFSTREFPEVQYTYDAGSRLTCNGIIIQANPPRTGHTLVEWRQSRQTASFIMQSPRRLAITDPNSRLPLNLTRDKVDWKRTTLVRDVRRSLYRNLYAYVLERGPSEIPKETAFGEFPLWFKYSRLDSDLTNLSMETAAGYGLWDPVLALKFGIRRVLFSPFSAGSRFLGVDVRKLPSDTARISGPNVDATKFGAFSGRGRDLTYAMEYILRFKRDLWLSALNPVASYVMFRSSDVEAVAIRCRMASLFRESIATL